MQYHFLALFISDSWQEIYQMTLPLFPISGCNVSPNGCAEHPHILFYKVMNKLKVDRNANLTEGRNAHSNRLVTGCKVIHSVVPNAHCHFTSITR